MKLFGTATIGQLSEVKDVVEGLGQIVERTRSRALAQNGRLAGYERRLKHIEAFLEKMPPAVDAPDTDTVEEETEAETRESALQVVRRANHG